MARKGQFKKGGGRHGGGSSKSRKRRSSSTSLVVVTPRAPARRHASHHPAKRHKGHGRRRGHGGGGRGGVTIPKLVGTTLVLANVCGTNNGPLGDKVYNLVQKIPGAKTFGGAATAGLAAGAIYKFTRMGGRFRPYLACAGLIGVIGAALKIGEQGTAFKWLGDTNDQVMDVE
jgi:hypothetical protein